MSLSTEDREWIGAIVSEAIIKSLNAGKDFSRRMVEDHTKACPNLTKLKYMIFGLGVGVGLACPQIAKALIALACGHA